MGAVQNKKRSDRLGEQYTRQAIEERLLENRKKKQNNQQSQILSMSEWIALQQAKKTEEKQIQSAEVKPIQPPVVLVAPQPIITPQKKSKGEKEEMQKEILEQEKISRQLQKQREREKEYQELLKERQHLQIQLRELKKLTEAENDICDENDYAKRDSLEIKIGILNHKMKCLKKASITKVSEPKLDERLLPQMTNGVSKDRSMSM